MRAPPPASLTGTLLFHKGNASPNGFSTRPRFASPSGATLGTVQGKELGGGGTRKNGARKSASGTPRLSVRLTPEQHRRLRIVAAHTRQSVPALIKTALDRYIDELAPVLIKDGCHCLLQPLADGFQPFEVSSTCCGVAGLRCKEDQR